MKTTTILLLAVLLTGLLLSGCNREEPPTGQATSSYCQRLANRCGFVTQDTAQSNCEVFYHASDLPSNSDLSTGNDVCEQSNWGHCIHVLSTTTTVYSHDMSTIFLPTFASYFVDCNTALSTSEGKWHELTDNFNPFDEPLYSRKIENSPDSSVLCCKVD